MALKDVKGHERQIDMLRHALKTGRVSSSYLFAGEEGIGKKLIAVNFAKALNCKNAYHDSLDACDKCSSCRKIDSNIHPDFSIIGPEQGETEDWAGVEKEVQGSSQKRSYEIKVSEIRRIEEEVLSLKSFEAKTKVVIVDDAHAMNLSASNAFLKSLEEPPLDSVIILITSSPNSLLETIRSRCMRINFKPLSPENSRDVIRTGRKSRSSEVVDQLVRLSMGRPGLAVSDDLIKGRDRFMELLKAILTPQSKALWKDRADIEQWLDTALTVLRDMAVFKITASVDALINRDMAEAIKNLCSKTDTVVIIECYRKLLGVRGYVRFNLNKAITWNYVGSVLRGSKVNA
ncbi:MAG: AAA family ATPase [Nitrospirae bacterium]|nr:AAA family ATPase [Nitrospirota bacterium]